MPIAALDPVFVSTLLHLQGASTAAALATRNDDLRTWHVPPGVSNPLLGADIALALSRVAIGEKYGEAMYSDYGSAGDAASLKVQSDYVATLERAYRLRHATPVRCRLHAAARRAAHGLEGAGVFARVGAYAQDLILAGGVNFAQRT